MTWNVLTLALCSAGWLFGAEQLNLAICNQGHTSERNIAIARTEAELLFRTM